MFSQKRKSSFTVLGPDIGIDGDLAATADLHLDGRVDGDIKCAALVQGETSEIMGMVVAENARVAGKIKGSISADTLVILKTARNRGRRFLWYVVNRGGAQVEGNFSNRAAEPKLMLAGGTEAV